MNSSHRIIWNRARQAYVAAGENARSAGKSKAACVLVTAVAGLFTPMALAAPAGPPNHEIGGTAASDAGDVTIDSPVAAKARHYAVGIKAKSVGKELEGTDDTTNFSLTNTADITAETTTSRHDGRAYGIKVSGDIEELATLKNAGNVTAVADEGRAYGVSVEEIDEGGRLINDGSISARVKRGTAYGVQVREDIDDGGALINNGSISAAAEKGNAYGVQVEEEIEEGESLVNTGSISASVKHGKAYGVQIKDKIDESGTLSNSGTIAASATHGTAYGVQIGKMVDGAILRNEGEITATAGEGKNAGAYAVKVDRLDGTIDNYGLIRAGSTDDPCAAGGGSGCGKGEAGYAIYAEKGDGSVHNNAGGVIEGRVWLGGKKHRDIDLTNHGVLSIGASKSSVSGDYYQSESAMLKLELEQANRWKGPDYRHGSLAVGGTATFEEGTQIRVKGLPGLVNDGDTLDVVQVDDQDLSATTFRISDNILAHNFSAAVVDSGKNQGISLIANPTGITSIVNAVTGNGMSASRQLGATLDQMILNPECYADMTEHLYDLGSSANNAELAAKVATLVPAMSGNSARASLTALTDANRIVQSRIEGVTGRSSGDETLESGHLWVKTFGTWSDQEDSDGASGYDGSTYGVVFGGDGLVTPNNRIGLALSYSTTEIDAGSLSARQSAEIDNYQLSIYGSYSLSDDTDINYLLGGGRHETDGKRVVLGGAAKSSYDSDSLFAGVGLAHTIALSETLDLTPSVRLDYAKIRADSYTENGPTAQHVSGQTAEELVLGVDGKLSYKLNERATLTGNLGLGYDMIGDRDSATAAFVGTPGLVYTVEGPDTERWRARGGIGVVGRITETVEMTARFDIEARENFTNQTASVKLRKSF